MPPKKSTAAAAKKEAAPATKKSTAAAKKDDAAAPAKVAKGASMKASASTTTAASSGGDNAELIKTFQELMMYETKVNKWASVAYNKVVKVLAAHPTKISSSADVADKDGVGKASKEKIDEFLTTGKLKKLEEYREEYGALDEAVVASVTKSGGAKLASKPPTAAVLKKIKAAKENFAAMSVDNLKALLRTNRQGTTGAKDELAQRCAEGLVLGAIPACPLCYAGKPRYTLATGIYNCPGYMDDDEFKKCFYESNDLQRDPWNGV